MNKNTYVLIMAGGVGSRFWPKSRDHFPKQFIDILGVGSSLLQQTYTRFLNICPQENIFILSNEQYKDLIREQIPEITSERILLEPSRNNTAPCIAYACYKLFKVNPEANIVVAPSDHLILKENFFLDKIVQALNFTASNDALVTLGITPTRPDTGYGYIKYNKDEERHSGIATVEAFMEKPSLEKAINYLSSKEYLWNAGIFVWSAKSIKAAFEQYATEIDTLFSAGNLFYNTDEEKRFILENYSLSPNISIDYAILEKANNVFTIPADIGWSDLGTWASLHSVAKKDEYNNSLNCSHIHIERTSNCIVQLPKDKAAVIKGLEDYIIVDDGKVLLIYPKSDEQEIKEIASKIVHKFGIEYR